MRRVNGIRGMAATLLLLACDPATEAPPRPPQTVDPSPHLFQPMAVGSRTHVRAQYNGLWTTVEDFWFDSDQVFVREPDGLQMIRAVAPGAATLHIRAGGGHVGTVEMQAREAAKVSAFLYPVGGAALDPSSVVQMLPGARRRVQSDARDAEGTKLGSAGLFGYTAAPEGHIDLTPNSTSTTEDATIVASDDPGTVTVHGGDYFSFTVAVVGDGEVNEVRAAVVVAGISKGFVPSVRATVGDTVAIKWTLYDDAGGLLSPGETHRPELVLDGSSMSQAAPPFCAHDRFIANFIAKSPGWTSIVATHYGQTVETQIEVFAEEE